MKTHPQEMADIKTLRKLVGVKQQNIAHHLGMDQGGYCSFENGRYTPVKADEIRKRVIEFLLPILENKIYAATINLNMLTRIKDEYQQTIHPVKKSA